MAFEASWSDVEPVQAALDKCGKELKTVSIPPLLNWDNPTVELVDWLCQYNNDHPEKMISVAGFDAQQPWHDIGYLKPFIVDVLPSSSALPLLENLYQCHGAAFSNLDEFRKYGRLNHFPKPTKEEHRHCLQGIAELDDLLQKHQSSPKVH